MPASLFLSPNPVRKALILPLPESHVSVSTPSSWPKLLGTVKDLRLLTSRQANKIACCCFIGTASPHSGPGSETRDLVLSSRHSKDHEHPVCYQFLRCRQVPQSRHGEAQGAAVRVCMPTKDIADFYFICC